MVRVRRKVAILVALLIISLSTVTFLTVKYVHTVRLFNSFYQSARETAEKIDAETAVLQEEITVLQQNIDFFGCGDISLPPLYDIQQLFAEAHELKDRPSLQKAMELVNIEADESMAKSHHL